jgi:hypothetical protein
MGVTVDADCSVGCLEVVLRGFLGDFVAILQMLRQVPECSFEIKNRASGVVLIIENLGALVGEHRTKIAEVFLLCT